MPSWSLKFERTIDPEVVRSILTDPWIWPYVGDDGAGLPENFVPTMHPSIWYVLAYDRDELLGCFAFHQEGLACMEVHTALLRSALRPKGRAQAAAIGMRRWIWERTQCHRITTRVPTCTPSALRFAQNAGLIEFGRNPMSWLKHGKLHDQVLLGISRPEGI